MDKLSLLEAVEGELTDFIVELLNAKVDAKSLYKMIKNEAEYI